MSKTTAITLGKEASKSWVLERPARQSSTEGMTKQHGRLRGQTTRFTQPKALVITQARKVSKHAALERLAVQVLSEVMVERTTMGLGMRTTPVRDNLSLVVWIKQFMTPGMIMGKKASKSLGLEVLDSQPTMVPLGMWKMVRLVKQFKTMVTNRGKEASKASV